MTMEVDPPKQDPPNPPAAPTTANESKLEIPDKSTLAAVLQILKKYNLKETEDLLRKEAKLSDDVAPAGSETDVSSVLSTYKSEGNPAVYEGSYADLKKFVESSLDAYKHELGMILYPVFVHMYLELVYNRHEDTAIDFMKKFGKDQEQYHMEDVQKLAQVTKREHMARNEIIDTFKSSEFNIRMSRDTLAILKRHLSDKKHSEVLNIIQEHLYFDMYEGVSRTKAQIDSIAGSVIGEATRQSNKSKMLYGMPKEPDVQVPAVDDDDDQDDASADKPKKKKVKKDNIFTKKIKNDPNAPPLDRIPFPELKDVDKIEKVKAVKEASKRVNLGPDSLPSICCYTLLNAAQTVICADICDDCSTLAVGFTTSLVKVWSLVPQKLRSMKSVEQLQDIDFEAVDVWARVMDERNADACRSLVGHSGPIYKVSFSPDRTLLLSCSEDNTVRLWSLLTWTCLVVYKAHSFPVWDVKFSPQGYYFITASHDRTARLWATDHHQPLRIFAGHFSDVDCIEFHPNSNYVATGSSDKTIRVWDCVTGNNVRLMTGHKSMIHALCFSVEGRFLVSAGADTRILVWDLAHGHLLAQLSGHTAPIHSLAFSREGSLLTSGSLDCSVQVWDMNKLIEEVSVEDVNVCHNPQVKTNSEDFLLRTYQTKNSPIIHLHFSRRNVLMAVAMFDSTL